MIRAIGNTSVQTQQVRSLKNEEPAPQTETKPSEPQPKPEPAPQQQLAFKGIVIKNVPKKVTVDDFVKFLKSGDPIREIKGGNMRKHLANDNTFAWDITKKDEVILGKTKEAEEVLYKDLIANKDRLPGVEIHKIDDWA